MCKEEVTVKKKNMTGGQKQGERKGYLRTQTEEGLGMDKDRTRADCMCVCVYVCITSLWCIYKVSGLKVTSGTHLGIEKMGKYTDGWFHGLCYTSFFY